MSLYCVPSVFNSTAQTAFQLDGRWQSALTCVVLPGQSIGFDCSPINSTQVRSVGCYGRTGEQVLDSMGLNFHSLSSKDTLTEDCLVMVAIALVFKLAYVAVLLIKVRKVARVRQVGPASASAEEKPVSFSKLEQIASSANGDDGGDASAFAEAAGV